MENIDPCCCLHCQEEKVLFFILCCFFIRRDSFVFSFRVGRRSITVIFHVTSASALLIATVVHLFGGKHVYCLVKTINSYLQ